jgi:LysR family transcriptional regulator, benzoate and cis,cis-muconate-responsive activator of ben and cat genes
MSADPRLLRPFVVLADELHFGRAADRLDVTQPALSQQIKRLELQLGVRLFARTRARVELTEVGAAVLAPARVAVQAAATIDDLARGFRQGERGELRLGISPGAHYVAQSLLSEFARRRPQIRVRASQDNSGALAAQIASGRLEVALGFCTAPTSGVLREPLLEEAAVVAVAAGHSLSKKGAVTLRELSDETFALVDSQDGPGYNRAVVSLCREAGFEPRTAPNPQGPMAWETAVRAQGCVGLTTRSAAASTARGIRLLRLDPPTTFQLELLQPAAPEETRGPAGRAFAELARSVARERPDPAQR